jgi:hypothetical protein
LKDKPQELCRQERVAGMQPVPGVAHPAEWMRHTDAVAQIYAAIGDFDLVAVELIEALRAGKVCAIERVVTINRVPGRPPTPEKAETYELTSDFWKAAKIHVWPEPETGDGLYIQEGAPPGSRGGWRHNIFFRRADIDALWPSAPAALGEPEAKSVRRKPGPRPRHNWKEELAPELIRRAITGEKIPLDNDAKVADQMGQWFRDQYDWEPDNADLRKEIAKLLASSRNSR